MVNTPIWVALVDDLANTTQMKINQRYLGTKHGWSEFMILDRQDAEEELVP
jgi:hypothetical protein